ncbi:craniofacial development protein 2-like [Penaeus indicus]|uniref:craniofacial development protein 2-like n=1 Tax=Penaeus indicus TaxID=29960 RepID=UPI00300DAA23
MIYSGGEKAERGVAVLLDKQVRQAVKEVDCCSDRPMVVRLSGRPVDIVVIIVYMPTSDQPDEEVEDVYDKIEEKVASCKGKDYVLVLGDMNATAGNEKILNVTGNYGLGNRNTRGEMLVDFCMRNNLTLTNTLFKNNQRRRQRYKTSVKNSCSYPGADVGSDHNLVIMKVDLKMKMVAKAKVIQKWNKDQLITEKEMIFLRQPTMN